MTTYKKAGVDIDAANRAVELMKKHVKSTYSKSVLAGIGSFGGIFSFQGHNLVSSIDGVGTKLKLAFMTGKHDTVGQDLVNHCVNDILVQGATPLFFMDYIGTGKLNPEVIEQIVKGMSIACKQNNCALLGGETAELPALYKNGEYDLAGCIVGSAKKIITGEKIMPGDIIIGLESNGLHTNGYSLALKVLLEKYKLDEHIHAIDKPLKEELMRIHKSYLKEVSKVLDKVKGMAHITGGGLIENIPRILPNSTDAEININYWQVPEIFNLIREAGSVPEKDMWRTFNMGIGFVLVVAEKDAAEAEKQAKGTIIGKIKEGKKRVVFA